MDTIRIVQYEHGERELEQLLALHKSFFERFCRDYQTADYFSDSLQTGSSRTFLAIEGDRVVGFARYGNEYRNPDMEFYRLILRLSVGRAKDKMWAATEIKRGFPNNPTLTYYDTPEIELIVRQWDYEFQDFGVHESFRGNGLGRRLAEHVLQDAIDRSSHTVYEPVKMFASIIEESQAHELALKLGFEPLIKLSPGYNDGASLVAMVKQLK